MKPTLWQRVRTLLAGRKLAAAIHRNECAANELDAAVKEVLNR